MPSPRTAFNVSRVHPRFSFVSVSSGRIRAYCLRTSELLIAHPSLTIGIFASAGIRPKTMLHPTHPARRASGPRAFLFSIADMENAKLGIRITLETDHSFLS